MRDDSSKSMGLAKRLILLWRRRLVVPIMVGMTQEEMDAILGRTRREYREAKAQLGAHRERHTVFVSELRKFLSALEQEPFRVYAGRVAKGTVQAAIEAPQAAYVFSAELAEKLTVGAIKGHLDEYRAAFERVEERRKSLIAQGDDDPGSVSC